MVPGVVGDDLRPEDPHLVDLRGVLHEVPRNVGPGEPRVVNVGEQPVQGVAELVEAGDHLVVAEQRRFPGGWLGDVQVVHHHGLPAQQPGLLHQRIHPGSAVLGVPGVVVAQEQAQSGAVLVEHLPYAHVRVVAGQVGPLLEGKPVQFVGGIKHAVRQHPLQFEVRPERGQIDVVFVLADPFRIEGPVPRLPARGPRPRPVSAPRPGRCERRPAPACPALHGWRPGTVPSGHRWRSQRVWRTPAGRPARRAAAPSARPWAAR